MINPPLNQLVREVVSQKVTTASDLKSLNRKIAKEYKVAFFPHKDILATYRLLLKSKKVKKRDGLLKILKKRNIRTLSGVAPVSVLTKPYPCPGKCIYCPTVINVPKSYLPNEPAVMRAILCKYDPFKQVKTRILALTQNGHSTDKIELIVIGGTWSYLPKNYQTWFIKRCLCAANGKNSRTLEEVQKINEKAKNRIVGITLETRADYINGQEIKRMRKLGATRVELGVQHLDNKILKYVRRGHLIDQTILATQLLKEAGFKVTYHMMPGLPGSSYQKDLAMFKELFRNPDFQPDQLKIYPCVVTRSSALYALWKQGKYRPYNDKKLVKLLKEIKKIIPPYVRIIRVIRDIPSPSIVAGNKISNLRQLLPNEKISCRCIRCREARNKTTNLKEARLFIKKYRASGGEEYFLSYENKIKDTLFAFLRLRLPKKNFPSFLPNLNRAALIRELHTYGELVPIKTTGQKIRAVQHLGFGKLLMKKAEEITKN